MNKTTKTILALVLSGIAGSTFFLSEARAVQLNGNITFTGTVNLNTSSAGTATAVTGWHGAGGIGNPLVVGADGDFLGFVTPGVTTAIFATPWFFNSGPVSSFWTAGGFTFNLTVSSIVTQIAPTQFGKGGRPLNGMVAVTGTGFVSGHGFAWTPGTWAFTTQDAAAGLPPRFSFSAAGAGIPAPDGGSSVALLGLALAAIEVVRRKLKAR